MNAAFDRSQIPGWGADLRPEDRPAVPKERTPPRLEGLHWGDPPEPQPRTVEVLHSIERPGLTPVFGSSVPPRGLSGWLRRRAFRRSEGDLRHWLTLLLADRVDVVESALGKARRSQRVRTLVVGAACLALLRWLGRH